MKVDFKLVLEFVSDTHNACILLSDRQESIATIYPSKKDIELCFKFSVPNQLTFVLNNLGPQTMVALKQCWLGGLELPQSILNQICSFAPASTNESLITTQWWEDGKVKIDFFAEDWVQYHLLYGNKITV